MAGWQGKYYHDLHSQARTQHLVPGWSAAAHGRLVALLELTLALTLTLTLTLTLALTLTLTLTPTSEPTTPRSRSPSG